MKLKAIKKKAVVTQQKLMTQNQFLHYNNMILQKIMIKVTVNKINNKKILI